MFENLTKKLSGIFSKLKGHTIITYEDLGETMGEIRTALLEADVSLDAVEVLITKINNEAIGKQVIKSVSPDQMIIKIVRDAILELLRDDTVTPLNLDKKLTKIMLVGLQGSGKTTTAAKLIHYLTKNSNKKSLLVSVDVYRPAAIEQLELLANHVGASFTKADPVKDKPLEILNRSILQARSESSDLIILDTAGRLHTDSNLMDELKELKKEFQPDEIFLVIDSMTGQDAINIAKEFHSNVKLTGTVLSRIDGDPRGGVALSMKIATSVPIRFMGVGEKFTQLELFDPERIANRILDMGDVVSLVEQAQQAQDQDDDRIVNRMQRGYFDLNDFSHHFKKIEKMGGLAKILSFLPGLGGVSSMLQSQGFDGSFIKKNLAIISSMTFYERKHPEVLKNSRKLRIASGSGTTVQEINRLLKQYEQMYKMVRKMKDMPPDKIKHMFDNMI